MSNTLLSLFDYTGNWSKPYREKGHHTIQVDMQATSSVGADSIILNKDVRLLTIDDFAPFKIGGVIAAPPCDHMSGSGARWWKEKGEEALLWNLSVIDACYRIIESLKNEGHPVKFYAIENPVGRTRRYLGKPAMYFNPNEYAGYLDNPDEEAYTKKTCLWGSFNVPKKKEVIPTLGSKMHLLPPSAQRKNLRSQTPLGFARAFCEANPL